jgi:hypothetical protein
MSRPQGYREAYGWIFSHWRGYNIHQIGEKRFQYALEHIGEAKSVIDVGSGKGTMLQGLLMLDPPVQIVALDVGKFHQCPVDTMVMDITEDRDDFPSADLTICLDVLEHIYEEDMDRALLNLSRMAPRCVATIANDPAPERLGDGFQIHPTVRGTRWWNPMIESYFSIMDQRILIGPNPPPGEAVRSPEEDGAHVVVGYHLQSLSG